MKSGINLTDAESRTGDLLLKCHLHLGDLGRFLWVVVSYFGAGDI